MEDLYSVLGVSSNATADEIKQRFRFLAQAYHPDKFASDEHRKQAEEQFKTISAAYQILSNPEKRAIYDAERLVKEIFRHQEPPKRSPPVGNQTYTRSVPTTASKTSQPTANKSFPLWIVISLMSVCGILSLCFFGLPLLSSNFPIILPTKTVTPYNTATLIPVMPTKTKFVLPPTYTPTATLVPLDGRLIITHRDSGVTWEIGVEKILVADSLTSPITGRVDKAAGRFVIIFLQVTNRGLSTSSFVCVCGTFDVQDADGNKFEEHNFATSTAEQIYQVDGGLDINPDNTVHEVAVFDISLQSSFYMLVPGIMSKTTDSKLVISIP